MTVTTPVYFSSPNELVGTKPSGNFYPVYALPQAAVEPRMASAKAHASVASGLTTFRILKIAFDGVVLGGITSMIFRVNPKVAMGGNMVVSYLEGLLAQKFVEGKKSWTHPAATLYRRLFSKTSSEKQSKAAPGEDRGFLYFVGSLVTFLGSMTMATVNNLGKRYFKGPTRITSPRLKKATFISRGLYPLQAFIERYPVTKWLGKNPGMMFVLGGVGSLLGGCTEALLAQGIADKATARHFKKMAKQF